MDLSRTDVLLRVIQHLNAGRLAEADRLCRIVLEQLPTDAYFIHLQGVVATKADQLDRGLELIRQAISLDSSQPDFYHNLGIALERCGDKREAAAQFRTCLDLNPAHADAHFNLGRVLSATHPEESLACFRRALELNPQHPAIFSSVLASEHNFPQDGPAKHYELHRCWNERFARPLQAHWQPHLNLREPDRRLRIGFVSADLHLHPVGRFLLPLLEHLDQQHFEVYCYSHTRVVDEFQQRLRKLTQVWREIKPLSDDQVAQQVRQDVIDILIDLSGHTGDHRLLVFARKPAPLQVSWLGYFNSTGLDAIDFIFLDEYLLDPGDQQHCSEKIVLLPGTRYCFRPPEQSPLVADAPWTTQGHVTLACTNRIGKINDLSLRSWARILHQVDSSRIVLKGSQMTEPEIEARFRHALEREGIAADRVMIEDSSTLDEYLSWHANVDLLLDTFPFSGSTTTLDGLWMGVPIVTLRGSTIVSRQTSSHLANLGLANLITRSTEEYEQVAVALCREPQLLQALRQTIRPRMLASPLCDLQGFGRSFAAALRSMWRDWCQQ